ncbi:MAG: hypothetical protein ABIF18_03135 [archaeon]
MKKTFAGIVSTIALFGLVGCASVYIPEKEMLRKIEGIPYRRGVMDCKDKSIMDHNHLKSKGIESRVVLGTVEGYRDNHAWTEVLNPETGKWHLRDPTWYGSKQDREGYEVERYSKKGFFNGCYPKRVKLCEFYNDVTKEDIVNGKYKKIFYRNMVKHLRKEMKNLKK